jgi:cAMP-dependent protein kinase regulator
MATPEEIRAHKDKAVELLAKGKLDAAAEACRTVCRMAPTDMAARQKFAEVLARAGKKDEAIKEYELVANRYANDGLVLKAIAISKVVLQLDPRNSGSLARIAELYGQRGASDGRAAVAKMVGAAPAPRTTPPAPAPAPAPAVEVEVAMEVDTSQLESDRPACARPHIPLFSDLSAEAFMAVSEGVSLVQVPAGQDIVVEGDIGTSMYAIVQGTVDVIRAQDDGSRRAVAKMGDGDFFGEMALVADAPRMATVAAATDCELMEFNREKVHEITTNHPSVRDAILSFYRERLLANLLRSTTLFAPLPPAARKQLVAAFELKMVPNGEVLMQQGGSSSELCVLLRGRCEVTCQTPAGVVKVGADLREGAVFGEVSLLLGVPASATVQAVTPSLILTLAADPFNQILASDAAVQLGLMRVAATRLYHTVQALSGLITAGEPSPA